MSVSSERPEPSFRHVFGPVMSRRLGVSLGVDLVVHKTCNMDCIYCECGRTTHLTCDRKAYISFEKVCGELDQYWAKHPDPDYITFSGTGEPTLSRSIGDVIHYIKTQKPHVKVAVLTNSGQMGDPEVRTSLLEADLVVPSLDAASPEAFRKINRPHTSVDVNDIIQGLETFRSEFKGLIWLEVFILQGINDSPADLSLLKKAIARIKPDQVQLNTMDRPGTIANLKPASREKLVEVARILDEFPVEIIARVPVSTPPLTDGSDARDRVLQTIARRPSTLPEIQYLLGIELPDLENIVRELEKEQKIEKIQQENGLFYRAAQGDSI